MYLGQDTDMSIWAGCIYVRIVVCGYGLSVSWSRYDCECMGCLYLLQDMGVGVGAGCI
jgi:hypothetical protein